MKTMLPRTLAALLVAAAALPVVAVQAAETLTVQTFNEKNAPVEVVIPKDPKRVAVLDYAVLDTMDAWGLGDRVTALPKSTALPWLAKYKNDSKIVNTGTPKEVDFEALMASEPDVIFVSGRLVKKIPELRRIAPVIYQKTDRELGSLKQTKAKLVQLGGIFGKTAEAEAAGRAFDERAAAIRTASAGRTAVVGMVTSSHFNMLGLKSKGSLIGNEFGFKNIAHGANTDHGSESSFELLVKLNPDFIFVCDRDSAISRPGAASAFVMEIPPYHIPTVKGVMLRTWDRLKGFVLRAGRVIVVIVACLSILNSMGTDGTWGHEDTNESVLSEIGRTIVPVLEPMGVSEENWPAAVGIFTGVLAKEAVVGTMNSLYDSMARAKNAENGVAEEASEDEAGWSFGATLVEALESVRTNLADLGGALLDPAGIHVDDLSDTAAAAEEQEVAVDTIDMMQQLFGGGFAAFCYLLMVLLYMPCGAAVATVWREAGTAWTLFLCGWTTALGYTSATIVYRLGTFAENPTYSIVAIALSVAILAGMLLWMRTFAKKNGGKGRKVIPIYATR